MKVKIFMIQSESLELWRCPLDGHYFLVSKLIWKSLKIYSHLIKLGDQIDEEKNKVIRNYKQAQIVEY